MNSFFDFFRSSKGVITREAMPNTTKLGPEPDGEGSGSFTERIVTPRSPQATLTISAVYRAVELRAKTEAQFQMQYQRKNVGGDNYIPDMWGPGKKLNYLLQVSPNPIMTAATFFQQLVINKLMTGNAFAYIERDNVGDVSALWLAQHGGYNPVTNTYTLTWATDRGLMSRFEAPARDVIHIPNTFREPNGYLGISTLRFMLDTLSMIKTQNQQALETAAKGGRVKLLIGEDQSRSVSPIAMGLYDKKEMEKYAEEIQNKLYSHDVLALRALDKVTPISMSAQDQQLIELLNASLDDVARYFGTPRPLLMMDTNSHYTTPTNATLEYMTRTIQPDVEEIEQEFTRKLLGFEDFGRRKFHMCEQPLLRLDKVEQARVDESRLRSGTATVNELRKQYDLPSVKGGDTVYILTNLAELCSEKLRSSAGNHAPAMENKNKTTNE